VVGENGARFPISESAPPGAPGEVGEVVQKLHRLLHEGFAHHHVGCDACGMFPIVGRRYKCNDCPDYLGYDLCGGCFDQGLHIFGRFNQRHTSGDGSADCAYVR
jgi:Zinc finger, ZZ type